MHIKVDPSAVDAHLAHGDYLSELDDTDDCGACGNSCTGDVCNTPVCNDGTCGTTPVVCEDDDNVCTDIACSVEANGCARTCNTIDCTTDDGAPGTCTECSCVANCTPPTCPPGANCGSVDNGCGAPIQCGPDECPTAGQTCGGGGIPNVCGSGGNAICFLADGCTGGTCGPQGSGCICTSEEGNPSGAGFCFSQNCGAVCTSSADCVDQNGVQYGRCSHNEGCCNNMGDCIAFANIEVCDATGFAARSALPPVKRK